MESNQSEGIWKQTKGDVKRAYGKVTDNEVKEAEGNLDKLSGKIQQRYGQAKEAVAAKLNRIFDRYRARRAPDKV